MEKVYFISPDNTGYTEQVSMFPSKEEALEYATSEQTENWFIFEGTCLGQIELKARLVAKVK